MKKIERKCKLTSAMICRRRIFISDGRMLRFYQFSDEDFQFMKLLLQSIALIHQFVEGLFLLLGLYMKNGALFLVQHYVFT